MDKLEENILKKKAFARKPFEVFLGLISIYLCTFMGFVGTYFFMVIFKQNTYFSMFLGVIISTTIYTYMLDLFRTLFIEDQQIYEIIEKQKKVK